jgi:hypothetical protein
MCLTLDFFFAPLSENLNGDKVAATITSPCVSLLKTIKAITTYRPREKP